MDAPRVSVIIPNWNCRQLLQGCLAALQASSWSDFEVLVVDNGSEDGSLDWLQQAHPEVRSLALGHNTGFTGAVNAGIRASHGELLALLNNDVQVRPDWLERLVDASRRHPRAGLFASRLLRAEQPERLDAAGDGLRRSGRAYGIARGELDAEHPAEEREVFGASFGAALLRREMLDDVGLLDDAFFAYVEDTDLALRAWSRGWRCVYVPAAVGLHEGSASSRGREERRSLLCLRNHLYFLLKSYPAVLLLRHAREVAVGIGRELGFSFRAVRVRHGGLRALLELARVLLTVALRAPRMLWARLRQWRRRRVPASQLARLVD